MKNYFCTFGDDYKNKLMGQFNPITLNISKKILARESIFRNLDTNIPHDLKKSCSFLNEQQIKTSSIYQKLLHRIQKCKRKQDEQKRQFLKNCQNMSCQMKQYKKCIQDFKLQIWEAKNEIIELQQALNEQIQESNQLYNQIGEPQSDQEDNNQQYDQQPLESEQQSGSIRQQQSQEQIQCDKQQYSKPSCSIKYFISNRSITTPNMSKQILSVGEGQRLFTQNDSNQQYTQLYLQGQSEYKSQDNQSIKEFRQQQNQFFSEQKQQYNGSEGEEQSEESYHNIMSFKKTQNYIFEQN